MKVNFISAITPVFKGVREDRNTVSQLKENNNYSLTEPNQRRINKAIENLAQQRGEENIKFLLDVGENLKYQGHLPDKKLKSKNDWSNKLKRATEESLAHSNPILREKYQPEIERVFSAQPLTKDEEKINEYKSNIMKRLKDSPFKENIEKNLDYFVTSSETPIEQKKYVMKRFDHFMSSRYKINPQLENKKDQILSEMANDISVKTPDGNVPNIKAINQKTHGMCAAIAIVRKAIAYEDKPNYVDAILSEMDDSDKIMVYDRQNLGKGKRVPVKKAWIDFDYAQQRGYRIVDASTLQWMNIAGMYGVQNQSLIDFNAFDKNNFDAFHDSFFIMNMADEKLAAKQAYFQSLTKAKSDIGSLKSDIIKSDIEEVTKRESKSKSIDDLTKLNKHLRTTIDKIAPKALKQSRVIMMQDVMQLSQPLSADIKKLPKELQKYAFIPNEEESQKQKKIKAYFTDNYGTKLINKDVLAQNAENIVFTLEEIDKTGKNISDSTSLPKQIAKARKLYEAEAIYRASVVLGLNEDDNRDDILITRKIPDKQTRIVQGYDKVIERIEKKNDKKLMEHFAPYYETTPEDKEGILKGLRETKETINYFMTDIMDDLYKSIGCVNRREILLNDMNDCITAVKNGDKKELNRVATCIGIKEDKRKAIKNLEELRDNMINNPEDEKAYTEAFNKMGYKDQIDAFVTVFNTFTSHVADPDNPERELYLMTFRESNNIPEDATDEQVLHALGMLGAKFNAMSEGIADAASMLEVENDDGSPYFTVNVHNIVMKQMENEGKLVPASSMKKLQERFAKIDKIRSSDEFASRQGKISDPSLYKLSKEEKQAIKQINKKVNSMYADVTRNLNHQYREIKEPLGELARYIGTNQGCYWVPRDGESGLFDAQQIKIFEQITDRPYRGVSDINKAVKLIKNGTHSGISGSSVFHNKYGGHAMYVADVVKDEKTGKDILYHDNSWGASEHENTWIDSNGLTRTDYSDFRGGKNGYITNKDYRNGNLVEELTLMKGHISPDTTESKVYKKINPSSTTEDWDFPMMTRVILEGNDPDYKDAAASIRDEIFFPDSEYIKTLSKHASKMSKKELQANIFRNLSAANGLDKKYHRVIEHITPTPFNKGIQSLEDYNNLPDNDFAKIAFEKAAIRRAYPDAPMYDEVADAKTLDDLKKVKSMQRRLAKEDFKYAFGKNKQFLLQMSYDNYKDMSHPLVDILQKNKVQWDLDSFRKVLKNVTVYEKDEKELFTGSLKDSIDFVVNKAGRQFDENIKKQENSEKAKEEFLVNLRETLEKDLYFNKDDLKAPTRKAIAVRQWIDDTFKPTTDDEFVQIYRNLQDMKLDEFKELTKNLDDKYMGMRSESGYDILTKVQNANESSETLLRNVLYYDDAKKDIRFSKTQKAYKYRKLERNSRGIHYIGDRSFDDLYRSMYYSLQTLDYERMFNKYRESSYRKYGVLPAYPKIDLSNDEGISAHIEKTKSTVLDSLSTVDIQKRCVYDIKLAHFLDNYRKTIPDNRPLKPEEKTVLDTLLTDFILVNSNDGDLDNAVNGTYELLDKGDAATLAEYNENIDTIVQTIGLMENINSVEDFESSIKSHTDGLHNYFNTILEVNIPQKYQRLVKDDFYKWVALETNAIKQNNNLPFKDTMDLGVKISQYSNNIDKKSEIEGFFGIINKLDELKEKNQGKQDINVINSQIADLHKLSDEYLDKVVDADSKEILRSDFNDLYRKELIGGNKKPISQDEIDMARMKFEDDFKKHHYTSHPTEVLNNYLLTQVNDSDKTIGKVALKSYLETELNMAKNIAIQDSLMEAVQNGNAAHVKEYFDDYYVSIDDNTVSMNSDIAIDYMIRSLILNKNPETAKMFVEKLGLGERVLKIERETIKNVNAKEKIDKIADLLRNSYRLSNAVKQDYDELLAKIDNIENNNELNKAIFETRKAITEHTKDFEDKDSVKRMLKALNYGKIAIENKPEVTKSVVMGAEMNEALSDINDACNEKIQNLQSYINVVNVLYTFLKNIQLPEYSKAKVLQDEIAKEHEALAMYNNEVINNVVAENPNVSVSKKAF